MAQRLGVSAEAAQKRVTRAVERLRESLWKRGITLGASGLGVVISANAIQAAPAALSAAIVAGAFAASTSAASTATAATKAISRSAKRSAAVVAALALVILVPIYLRHRAPESQSAQPAAQFQPSVSTAPRG